MKQRLNLARAVVNTPKLIIMDEPINGLDPKAVSEFKEYIRHYVTEHNGALLISSHALKELLFFCNQYIFIKDGNIVTVQGVGLLKLSYNAIISGMK